MRCRLRERGRPKSETHQDFASSRSMFWEARLLFGSRRAAASSFGHGRELDGHSPSFFVILVVLPMDVRQPAVARDHVENHLTAFEVKPEIQLA
jgi:hypothetical protein